MREAFSLVELDHPGGDHVEEVAIVGHENQSAAEGEEELFEPANRFGVEVVGGFVEEKKIRLGREGTAERHAALFPTGKRGDRIVQSRSMKSRDERLDPSVEIPAIGVVDQVEEIGEFALGSLARFILAHRGHQIGGARLDIFAHREALIEFELLGEIAHANAALSGNLATVRLFEPAEYF